MRISKREVEGMFQRLGRAITAAGDDATLYTLSVWSPGDGATRYKVEREGSHVTSNAMGASEAYYMLASMCSILEHTTRERDRERSAA